MVAVNYLWTPINDNIVREFDDAGATIADYTTEPGLYGNVVSQYRDGQTSYLLSNGQGSTTEVTNDSGTVTDTIRYPAFGEVIARTGTTVIPFQYVGQKGYYRDSEPSELSVRQRPLSPTSGRWLCADPSGLLTDFNRYRYVENAPTMRIDPSGLETRHRSFEVCEPRKEFIQPGTPTHKMQPDLLPCAFAIAGYDKDACTIKYVDWEKKGIVEQSIDFGVGIKISLAKVLGFDLTLKGSLNIEWTFKFHSRDEVYLKDCSQYYMCIKYSEYPSTCYPIGIFKFAYMKRPAVLVDVWINRLITVGVGGQIFVGATLRDKVAIPEKLDPIELLGPCSCSCLGPGWEEVPPDE